MNIVIVESAAKAKTINKYLGADYKVIASYGHVRDLPAKDGSVLPDNDFEMTWEVESNSQKVVNEIAKAVKGASRLILATDPDREGEAISWHLLKILEQKRALNGVSVERVAFNAVTKDAIMTAMAHPRKIDEPLVDAYLARRALDYLVGFTLSPVLWRKLPGARSAGRVQSVALRLVVDREAEIEAFKTREYWTVEADLRTAGGDEFQARLVARGGKKLDKFDIPDEATAHAYRDAIEGQPFRVESIEAKEHKRNPAPPFTTSSLQQEASRKLGLSPRQTMQIAQRLYEGIDIGGETVGLITYMRTDGVQIVPEAIAHARGQIETQFGKRVRAECAAHLQDEGEERAGSARGDPADRFPPPSRQAEGFERGGGAALQADLAARGCEPDGERGHRAHHGGNRGAGPRWPAIRRARHRLGRDVRWLPQALRGRPRRRGGRRGQPPSETRRKASNCATLA